MNNFSFIEPKSDNQNQQLQQQYNSPQVQYEHNGRPMSQNQFNQMQQNNSQYSQDIDDTSIPF